MNDLERSLIESPRLPSPPVVAQRILELIENEDAGVTDLAEIIALDPALCAKLLSVINSAAYGMARQVTTVRQAVLFLGMKSVRSIALSFSFVSQLRGLPSKGGLDQLWHTSLMMGIAARRLALEIGEWDSEEAFLVGLLCDCGSLLLYSELPQYRDLLRRAYSGEISLLESERAEFQTDHPRLGSLLLEHWNFPELYCQLVAYHHEPERCEDPKLRCKLRILDAAWHSSRAFTIPGFSSDIVSLRQRLSERFGLPESVIEDLLDQLPNELNSTASSLEIAIGSQRDYQDLLTDANRTLSEMALRSDRDAKSMAGAVGNARTGFAQLREILAPSLRADEETGIVSRGSFEYLFEAYFESARRQQVPVGILIIEIEDPSGGSARSGAPVPVAALAEIGKRIQDIVRRCDVVARFGERRIAVLAPGCHGTDLVRVASRLRETIENSPVGEDPHARACTAMGLADSIPHLAGSDPQSLLGRATAAILRARGSESRMARL